MCIDGGALRGRAPPHWAVSNVVLEAAVGVIVPAAPEGLLRPQAGVVSAGNLIAVDISCGYVRGLKITSSHQLRYGLIDLKIFTKVKSPDHLVTDVPSLSWISNPTAYLECCCSPWFAKEFCFLQHPCCCVSEELRKSYFLCFLPLILHFK